MTFHRLDCFVKSTQLGTKDGASVSLDHRRWITSRSVLVILIYHHHISTDLVQASKKYQDTWRIKEYTHKIASCTSRTQTIKSLANSCKQHSCKP